MILNTGYEALLSGIGSACFAQILKVVVYFVQNKKLNFKIFTTTGGMPSSHSAGVVGLATSVGIIDGYSSTTFAVAMGVALVVMYDAAGLRRAAGKTAALLNKIVADISRHVEMDPYEKLKELLGHTPFEVVAGAVLSVFCAYFLHFVILI